jgi:adenylate cyclase
MEKFHDTQLVKRFAKLVQQNKDISRDLRELREKYEDLLQKSEEYEQIVRKYAQYSEVKEVLSSDRPHSLKFNMATVLYAELHGFSEITEDMDSEALMDELDQLYIKFDEIIEKYPIAKIKTIGDSYMCAGGIPKKNITNPVEVILAAMQMLYTVKTFNEFVKPIWDIRLAVHTGPVTATVTGKQRITYDIKAIL